MPIDPTVAVTVGDKLIRTAHKHGWLKKFQALFRKKKTVLVLGSTGTGKTNLIDALENEVAEAIDRMNRTDFAQEKKIKLNGHPFVFVDVPGQEQHRPRRVRAIREQMGHSKPGVINVVSYGYHEYRTGRDDAVDDDGIPKDRWIQEHLKVERDALAEWVALLGSRTSASWLITVVTKADLWWDAREKVNRYYESGEYYNALGEARNLVPTVAEYCSTIHNFYEGQHSAHFDDTRRRELRSRLINLLLQTRSREARNE